MNNKQILIELIRNSLSNMEYDAKIANRCSLSKWTEAQLAQLNETIKVLEESSNSIKQIMAKKQ